MHEAGSRIALRASRASAKTSATRMTTSVPSSSCSNSKMSSSSTMDSKSDGSSSSFSASSNGHRYRWRGQNRSKGRGKNGRSCRTCKKCEKKVRKHRKRMTLKLIPPSTKYEGSIDLKAFHRFTTEGTAYVNDGRVPSEKRAFILLQWFQGNPRKLNMDRVVARGNFDPQWPCKQVGRTGRTT